MCLWKWRSILGLIACNNFTLTNKKTAYSVHITVRLTVMCTLYAVFLFVGSWFHCCVSVAVWMQWHRIIVQPVSCGQWSVYLYGRLPRSPLWPVSVRLLQFPEMCVMWLSRAWQSTWQISCWCLRVWWSWTMSLQGTFISQSAVGINTLVCPSLCPSVHLSVMLSVVVLSVGVGVKSCTTVFLGWYFVFTCMDVSFLAHFCRMHRSSCRDIAKNELPKFPHLE